jgi:hypothetical protein
VEEGDNLNDMEESYSVSHFALDIDFSRHRHLVSYLLPRIFNYPHTTNATHSHLAFHQLIIRPLTAFTNALRGMESALM